MKKFIQISLVVVLVLVLFQAAAGGSMGLAGKIGSNVAEYISSLANTPVQGVQVAACPGCKKPTVGWNS